MSITTVCDGCGIIHVVGDWDSFRLSFRFWRNGEDEDDERFNVVEHEFDLCRQCSDRIPKTIAMNAMANAKEFVLKSFDVRDESSLQGDGG